jgi:hypothetical protein
MYLGLARTNPTCPLLFLDPASEIQRFKKIGIRDKHPGSATLIKKIIKWN